MFLGGAAIPSCANGDGDNRLEEFRPGEPLEGGAPGPATFDAALPLGDALSGVKGVSQKKTKF